MRWNVDIAIVCRWMWWWINVDFADSRALIAAAGRTKNEDDHKMIQDDQGETIHPYKGFRYLSSSCVGLRPCYYPYLTPIYRSLPIICFYV